MEQIIMEGKNKGLVICER